MLDPSRPETLLYEPQKNGQLRLVGVEYFAVALTANGPYFGPPPPPPPPAFVTPRPTLFGQDFDGPMPGHDAGMPWHFDLHVWLWRNNPRGMFSPFNPKVTCEDAQP